MLICPKCQEVLYPQIHPNNPNQTKAWTCSNRHSYDVAKDGYVNLLWKNSTNHGDNKRMVEARTHFLNQQYYQPLCQKLIDHMQTMNHGHLLDMGCGQGYYTKQMQGALQTSTMGVDISKEAIAYASKQSKQIQYIVASNAALPIANECIDVALCLFSYLDASEALRVLRPGGHLIVVSPHRRHLFALKEILYETPYENEIGVLAFQGFRPAVQEELSYSIRLNGQDAIQELFAMTPYAYKTKPSDVAKLNDFDALDVECSFLIQILEKTEQD